MIRFNWDDSADLVNWQTLLTSACDDGLWLVRSEVRLTTNSPSHPGGGSFGFQMRWTDHDGVARSFDSGLTGIYGSPPPAVDVTHITPQYGTAVEFRYVFIGSATGYAGDLTFHIAKLRVE